MEQEMMNIEVAYKLLPKQQQNLIYELVISMIPDDIETPLDTLAHIEAMRDYKKGDTVSINDIDWN